jgi:hypothetical protein
MKAKIVKTIRGKYVLRKWSWAWLQYLYADRNSILDSEEVFWWSVDLKHHAEFDSLMELCGAVNKYTKPVKKKPLKEEEVICKITLG